VPLFIRDEHVNELAEQALKMTGGKNKTAVVRSALQAFIEAHNSKETLSERVAKVQSHAVSCGIMADGADDKDLMDDAWGDG